ncbi:MAG: hypothetical protein KGH75_01595 [Rhodospirillales bacterium]|nr:hypothetical protein [Rhodospirillales bacterium]
MRILLFLRVFALLTVRHHHNDFPPFAHRERDMDAYHQSLVDLVAFTADLCAANETEASAGNKAISADLLGLARHAHETAREIGESDVPRTRCRAYFALRFLRDNSTAVALRPDLTPLRDKGIAVFQRIHEIAFETEVAARNLA